LITCCGIDFLLLGHYWGATSAYLNCIGGSALDEDYRNIYNEHFPYDRIEGLRAVSYRIHFIHCLPEFFFAFLLIKREVHFKLFTGFMLKRDILSPLLIRFFSLYLPSGPDLILKH
jgi:hypothetical protein